MCVLEVCHLLYQFEFFCLSELASTRLLSLLSLGENMHIVMIFFYFYFYNNCDKTIFFFYLRQAIEKEKKKSNKHNENMPEFSKIVV